MSQTKFIRHIEVIRSHDKLTYPEFRDIRAKYLYAVFSSVPDILVSVTLLAQCTEVLFNGHIDNVLRLFRKL